MPANPVEAGRKGGQSRSEAKLAACRKNGFQKVVKLEPEVALEGESNGKTSETK